MTLGIGMDSKFTVMAGAELTVRRVMEMSDSPQKMTPLSAKQKLSGRVGQKKPTMSDVA
jgi:hypothetical protein